MTDHQPVSGGTPTGTPTDTPTDTPADTLAGSPSGAEFWRRTPPALFPSVFGLLGLGLAWRAAAGFAPLAASPLIGNGILAVVCLLFLFCLASYVSKLSARPAVLLEDMASVPGRAGAAAMSLCILLFAAALTPFSPLVGTIALWTGLLAQAGIAVAALVVMARTPKGLVISPAWHLSFVGFILAPLSAVPLGYTGLAMMILIGTILMSILIYAVSLLQLSRSDMPPPQRPLLMIHLAPVSLFTTVSASLGLGTAALGFAVLAVGVGAVSLSQLRYLTAAGFSPLWGAFTFPVAALATALFAIGGSVEVLGWAGLVPLVLATCATPLIALRILVMWINGSLAQKTGAAIA